MVPRISILLVVYNMPREAPRTIQSILPPYQKGIEIGDYEVLILDNGSSEPLPPDFTENLPSNVRLINIREPDGSPGRALNIGADMARSGNLMFCIDGARILSDRLIEKSIKALERFPTAFVYTMGWHLGPDVQMRSINKGYNQVVEDKLLEEANWLMEPDNLFNVSVLAGSSSGGIARPISESNAFCISRKLFEEIGGYHTGFKIPGGSTSNLELFERYVTRHDALNICLLSEGTFHQIHGGSATSNPKKIPEYFDEYKNILGKSYVRPQFETMFLGRPRLSAMRSLFGPDDNLRY